MDIQFVLINSVRPDPDQPRKTFPDGPIKEMAKSILTEGIINPIEIDSSGMIVTGETRWRAAKVAGLKEVPVKVIDPGKNRFRRQAIENIHHNTMTTMETANALHHLLVERGWKPVSERRSLINVEKGKKGFQGEDYVLNLANEIGKSEKFIYDHISLMSEDTKIKEWLNKLNAPYSLIREANRFVPEDFKEDVKEKIVTGDINTNRSVIEIGKALQRSPEKAGKILKMDLSKSTDSETAIALDKVAPIERTPNDLADRLINNIEFITRTLRRGFMTSLEPTKALILAGYLTRLKKHLDRFQTEEEVILEGEETK